MPNTWIASHRSIIATASAVKLLAASVAVSLMASFALGVLAPTLARAVEGRHALIIGISHYASNVGADTLEGVPYDMKSARQMAIAMGVDDTSIIELRDEQATKRNIEAQLARLVGEYEPLVPVLREMLAWTPGQHLAQQIGRAHV